MDQRENILKLWRREGFEFQPVHFDLCPALERKFHEVYGEEADYRDVFEFPFRNLRTGFLRQEFRDWNERCYPGREFLPGTSFSIWGVAHEPTPESMHMSGCTTRCRILRRRRSSPRTLTPNSTRRRRKSAAGRSRHSMHAELPPWFR